MAIIIKEIETRNTLPPISRSRFIYVIILSLFRKKRKPLMQEHNVKNKPYGMREIENPFENEIPCPNNQAKNVMVVVKDYKWYKLYKDDIFAISVMAAIIIIVVILSVFSFKVRAQSETFSSKDKANADSVMMHSLISIELTVDKLKEELDSVNVHINSVDVHITEGEKEISRAIRELKKNKNRGKK